MNNAAQPSAETHPPSWAFVRPGAIGADVETAAPGSSRPKAAERATGQAENLERVKGARSTSLRPVERVEKQGICITLLD